MDDFQGWKEDFLERMGAGGPFTDEEQRLVDEARAFLCEWEPQEEEEA